MNTALAGSVAAQYPKLELARASFLHPNEEAHFAALPAARRRTTYLLGRYAAKQALTALLPQVEPAAVDIVPGAFGQPVVRYPMLSPVDVSISHTDTQACALAFAATAPMAIDIERIDVRRAAVMKTQMLAGELELAAHCRLRDVIGAAVIWTAKEALSKALRCGMTCPFPLLAVDVIERAGDECLTGTFENFTQYKFETWVGSEIVVSIVRPRSSQLDIDMRTALAVLNGA